MANKTQADLNNTLASAVLDGYLQQVADTLKLGADPNSITRGGWPVIVAASADNRLEIVRLLVEAGANLELAAEPRHRALHAAAANGSVELIKLLIEAGADILARNGSGRTPLHIAVENNSKEAVLTLFLAAPSATKVLDAYGASVLDSAKLRYDYRDLKKILS